MMSRKRRREYRWREGDQVPTYVMTIREVMSAPAFELGAADARAGRPYRPDYDLWPDTNDRWNYERGRQWAVLAPRNVRLKRGDEITEEAHEWFLRHCGDIR
jgi:hypothetical protein